MFTPHVLVKPEPERISAELYSNAWRRLTLSWPQISGQRLISSNLHSSNSTLNLSNLPKRELLDQEERETEEEEDVEEEEEETEVAEEEEETEVEEEETEVDPEEETEEEVLQEPPSENDNIDIIIASIFSANYFSKRNR